MPISKQTGAPPPKFLAPGRGGHGSVVWPMHVSPRVPGDLKLIRRLIASPLEIAASPAATSSTAVLNERYESGWFKVMPRLRVHNEGERCARATRWCSSRSRRTILLPPVASSRRNRRRSRATPRLATPSGLLYRQWRRTTPP